jgi:hypothetical protein
MGAHRLGGAQDARAFERIKVVVDEFGGARGPVLGGPKFSVTVKWAVSQLSPETIAGSRFTSMSSRWV